jgi:hypothetical protein
MSQEIQRMYQKSSKETGEYDNDDEEEAKDSSVISGNMKSTAGREDELANLHVAMLPNYEDCHRGILMLRLKHVSFTGMLTL